MSILIQRRYWRYAAYKAYLQLITDASRYHLGWLWWVLEPLAMTGVFYVVFKFLRARDDDFIYFLVVGVTTWLWFSSSVSNATQSLNTAKSLISQVRVPKIIFPLINVLTGIYRQFFVFVILLSVVGMLVGVSASWTYLPLLIVLELLMIVAAAATAAFVCAWLPDFRFIIVSGLQLMMFCSGIFFDISSYAADVQSWFRLNPLAVLLEQYRGVLLYGRAPDFTWCVYVATICVLWIVFLNQLYKQFDHFLTRKIIA